jgi:hypothetical protein
MNVRTPRALLLAAAALCAAVPAHASQWLKLTAPAANATLPLLAQTVTFQYVIDAHGFRQHTHWNGVMGTWITICTGGCSTSADIIEGHELTASEQTTTSLPIAKIKQHLTQHNLPIDTKIKWNLEFHLPGTFYDNSERQTDSAFFLGHLEAAGSIKVEAKPTATPTPKPIH